MVRAKEQTYMNSAICHVCGEEMSYEAGVRPRRWACGMVGVSWVVCSYDCAETFDEAGRCVEDDPAGVAV